MTNPLELLLTRLDGLKRTGQGKYVARCPAHGDKHPSLAIRETDDGAVLVHCFAGCDAAEVVSAAGLELSDLFPPRSTERGITRAHSARPDALGKRQSLSSWGTQLWNKCLPISGVAMDYLSARQCFIPPEDGHLRWHPALKHPSGHVGPSLVGLITHVQTRMRLSLHRTWITPTDKANVNPPRMPLANHSIGGGCIRLWPDESVTSGLGIAEGIETALSLAWAYTPVWATIDAGHLRKFPVLDGVETLIIGCDQDEAGRKAARECGNRWASANREVLVTRQQKNDLNDVLTEAA